MGIFVNTINYLAIQMNNETSFKQHKKERFIIVAGVKEWEWERVPFDVAGQYVGPWFVGRVYEASSSSVFFSEGVPSGISSSGCERGLSGLLANSSLRLSTLPKGTRKNSSRRRTNQCALPVDWSVIAELLGRGIDSRKEIDLWLLQFFFSCLLFFFQSSFHSFTLVSSFLVLFLFFFSFFFFFFLSFWSCPSLSEYIFLSFWI